MANTVLTTLEIKKEENAQIEVTQLTGITDTQLIVVDNKVTTTVNVFEAPVVHLNNAIQVVTTIGDHVNDKFFVFTQAIPSNLWNVMHNLNKHPSVTVVNSAQEIVDGEVVYIDNSRLEIHFAYPFSGYAYLN